MKTAKIFSGHYSYLRRVAKQPVFRVTDHVHNKSDCTGKEVEGLYYSAFAGSGSLLLMRGFQIFA